MLKPTILLAVTLLSIGSHAQTSDTVFIYYASDKFELSQADKLKLDSFMQKQWDRIVINSHTDDAESDQYNLQLSKKRAERIYRYCVEKRRDTSGLLFHYYGESMPIADNNSEEKRALNRRTQLIGYSAPKQVFINRIIKPLAPAAPVTKALDNGLLVTYWRGSLPASIASNLDAGIGTDFPVLTNTVEMQQNNLYNTTTRGEILSSVRIVCGPQLDPCKLDSPIVMKVPVPEELKCSEATVKFFKSVPENGVSIWQEETRILRPEYINGVRYMTFELSDLCTCYNFDFKLDPGCFPTDTTSLYVDAKIKRLSAELIGWNSVYIPKGTKDSTYQLVYQKNKLEQTPVSFTLYKGKRRVRGYTNLQVNTLPYDEAKKRYILTADSCRMYFPKLEVLDLVVRMNREAYRVVPDGQQYNFLYLRRKNQKITVDFTVIGAWGKVYSFRNQPLNSLPYDESTGRLVINRKFVKELKQKIKVLEANKGLVAKGW